MLELLTSRGGRITGNASIFLGVTNLGESRKASGGVIEETRGFSCTMSRNMGSSLEQ